MADPLLEELRDALSSFLTSNNELLRKAIFYIKQFLKAQNALGYLLKIYQSDDRMQVKHTSVIILNGAISKKWLKTEESMREYIKNTVLELLVSEPQGNIRNSLAEIVCSIARINKPTIGWKNFWNIMYDMYSSDNFVHKETVLYILCEIADDISDILRDEFDKLLQILADAMNENQNPRVRIQALKACGAIISTMYEDDEYIRKYSQLLPLMMSTTKHCVEYASKEAINCFSTFGIILETAPSMFNSHIIPLTQFIISVGTTTSIEWYVRLSALNVIELAVKYKPTWFVKGKLVHTLMDLCATIGCEIDPEDMDEWGNTPFRYSCILLDFIARFINYKHTYNYFLYLLEEFSKSEDPYRKRMAIGLIAAMSDGCSEVMKDDLDKIIPFIEVCGHDAHLEVKKNSCILIGKLAEYLEPNILEYHNQLIPLIVSSLQTDDEKTIESACYSLDVLVERLPKESVAPYIDQLFNILMKIIMNVDIVDIQEMVLIAMGSLCHSSEDLMSPYFDSIMTLLHDIVALIDEDRLVLRARALDVSGQISKIVGKEAFSSYYDYFVKHAVDSFALSSTYINSSGEKVSNELRECSINFFSSIASSLGHDFDHYLKTVMDIILESLQAKNSTANADPLNGILDFDDEEDHSDLMGNFHHTVGLSDIEEKVTALLCLGSIAEAVNASILPYIETCIPLINNMSISVFPSARRASMVPLEYFVLAVFNSYPPMKEGWEPGLNPVEYQLNENTQQFIDIILDTVFNRIEVEFDLSVVVRYLETINFFAKNMGSPGVHKHIEIIVKVILECLEEKTVAQIEAIEEEDNEELKQDQFSFMKQTCELISTLSDQYKHHFLPYFTFLLKGILSLINNKNPDKDDWKITLYGTLDYSIESIGVDIFDKEHIDLFLELAFKGIQNEHEKVRSNATYLLGLCAMNQHSFHMYENILDGLMYIMTSKNSLVCLDNACGTLGKAILAAPDLIPYEHILGHWFEVLPIKTDFIECISSYGAIISMLQKDNQYLTPYIPRVIHIFTEQISIEEIDEDLKKQMSETLKFLWQKYQQDLQSILEELSPHQKENFEICLSTN